MPRATSRGPGTGPGGGSQKTGGRKTGAERVPKVRPGAKATKPVATGTRKARTPKPGDSSWGTSAQASEEISPRRKR